MASALGARPGERALIPRPYPPRSARTTGHSICRGLLAAHAPAGAYEAVSRTAGGSARVWVRYSADPRRRRRSRRRGSQTMSLKRFFEEEWEHARREPLSAACPFLPEPAPGSSPTPPGRTITTAWRAVEPDDAVYHRLLEILFGPPPGGRAG